MRFFLSVIFLLTTYFGLGQTIPSRHCASHYWDSLQLANNPAYAKARSQFEKKLSSYILRKKKSGSTDQVYQIPVVVHIVHDNTNGTIGGKGNSNISDEQILSQIQVLNEDFRRTNADTSNTSSIFKPVAADTEIEFCLASVNPNGNFTTGITRYFSDDLPYNPNSLVDNKKLKSIDYWPADQYMNIWVSTLQNDILGYATFPSDVNIGGLTNYYTPLENDGIVIDYRVFGKKIGTANENGYDLGRTATHEVGHWFGLFHIWGDADNCSATDYCTDTPNQFTSSSGCPNEAFSCTTRDMTENYMDYSFDRCMNIFTIDQKSRMRSAIELSARRTSLLNSLGCCSISKTTDLPFLEDFENTFDTTNLWTATDFMIVSSPAIENFSFAFTPADNTTDTSFLITPLIDLTQLSSPFISFQAYKSNNPQKLRITYSLTCTEKWNTLAEYTSLHSEQWNSMNLDLNSIKTLKAVRLRFEYITSETLPFYLDNINIHQENKELEVIIYPNPSTTQFQLDFRHQGIQNKTIELYSFLGVPLATFYLGESYSSIHEIDFSNFASGLYILKIYVADEVSTQRVTLSK